MKKVVINFIIAVSLIFGLSYCSALQHAQQPTTTARDSVIYNYIHKDTTIYNYHTEDSVIYADPGRLIQGAEWTHVQFKDSTDYYLVAKITTNANMIVTDYWAGDSLLRENMAFQLAEGYSRTYTDTLSSDYRMGDISIKFRAYKDGFIQDTTLNVSQVVLTGLDTPPSDKKKDSTMSGQNYFTFSVDHSKVAENLSGFTAVFDLADAPSGFWDHVQSADDMALYDSNDNPVPAKAYEFDAANHAGQLWYKADLSSASDDTFSVYYNGATPDSGGLWVNNAMRSPAGSQPLTDVSGNGNNADATYGYVSAVAGKVGKALQISNNNITISDSPSLQISGSLTLAMWIKTDTLNATSATLFFQHDQHKGFGYDLLDNGPYTDQILWKLNDNGHAYTVPIPRGDLNDGGWHLMTGVYNASTHYSRLYMDGVQVGSKSGVTMDTGSLDVIIGGSDAVISIDEISLETQARDANWIQTVYNNQNDVSAFYSSVGAEQSDVVALSAESLQQPQLLDQSQLAIRYGLSASNLSHSQLGIQPSVNVHYGLSLDDMLEAQQVSTAQLTPHYVFAGQPSRHGQTLQAATVDASLFLSADTINHLQELAQSEIKVFYNLFAGHLQNGQKLTVAAISSRYGLALSEVTTSQNLLPAALTANYLLTSKNTDHQQTLDAATLSERINLIAAAISHPQEITQTDLHVQYGLATQNLSHRHYVASSGIVVQYGLNATPLTQPQQITSPEATIAYTIIPNGLLHQQLLGETSLSGRIFLSSHSLHQSQSLVDADLSVLHRLSPASMDQQNLLQPASLIPHYVFLGGDITHSQKLSSSALNYIVLLAADNLTQPQKISGASGGLLYGLATDSITQNQDITIPDLLIRYGLSVSALQQSQIMSGATLIPHYVITPKMLSQNQELAQALLSVVGKATNMSLSANEIYAVNLSTRNLYKIELSEREIHKIGLTERKSYNVESTAHEKYTITLNAKEVIKNG